MASPSSALPSSSASPCLTPRVLLQDGDPHRWLAFAEPVAVLAASSLGEVLPLVEQAAGRVESEGLFAAGFLAYEAGPAFDPALVAHPSVPGLPLAWFALFRRAEPVDDPFSSGAGAYRLGRLRASMDAAAHRRAVARVQEAIARGDTYQVNLTYRLTAPFAGDPAGLARDLARAQGGGWGAYLDLGRWAVASASPELFFALDGERLACRPMKGTARRGRWSAEDRARAGELAASAKDRAENLMIVDMVRNDLGRVAVPGTVEVAELFAIERYPTVLQMTSSVVAESRAPVAEILAALFPSASITGAPKASTSRWIAELEGRPRGVYTGAVGYLAPGRKARFNVAIRTAVVDRQKGEVEYGVGGGVVWDSEAGAERREAQLKARVLGAGRRKRPEEFELLETMRWTQTGGYELLAEHLERMAGSAEYFGFAWDRADVLGELEGKAEELGREGTVKARRVRLLLARDGAVRIEASDLAAETAPLRLAWSPRPVDPEDVFLFHKTTRRGVYERARSARPEADEVLLWNARGEATEATNSSLVVLLDGKLVTPPLDGGLLPGTARAKWLKEGWLSEQAVRVEEVVAADGLYLLNSVRGLRWAVVEDDLRASGRSGRPPRRPHHEPP